MCDLGIREKWVLLRLRETVIRVILNVDIVRPGNGRNRQERVDRGGGGTGVEGAESGVEGAESGVEGAGSGGRGGGKRG